MIVTDDMETGRDMMGDQHTTSLLKRRQAELGISYSDIQARVIRAGGIMSDHTIRNILNGKNSPTLRSLRMVINALGGEIEISFPDELPKPTQ